MIIHIQKSRNLCNTFITYVFYVYFQSKHQDLVHFLVSKMLLVRIVKNCKNYSYFRVGWNQVMISFALLGQERDQDRSPQKKNTLLPLSAPDPNNVCFSPLNTYVNSVLFIIVYLIISTVDEKHNIRLLLEDQLIYNQIDGTDSLPSSQTVSFLLFVDRFRCNFRSHFG